MNRLGICFTGQPYTVRQIIEAARQAEQAGFDSVWVAEDSWTGRDAITVLTAVALNTSRVRIGTRLIGASTRHPVLIAQTFNVLREIAPGRLVLGLGYADGWKPVLTAQQHRDDSPLRTMREAVTALRALLDGGESTWGDTTRCMMAPRAWFNGANLPGKERVPIYMGAVGPRMTALAGELGDGLLFEMEAPPQSVRTRRAIFEASATASGRTAAKFEYMKLLLASVGPDAGTPQGKLAHHNALGWAAKSVAVMPDELAGSLGWAPDEVGKVRAAWHKGDWESGKSALTPNMVRTLVAAGPERQVVEQLTALRESGVTLPVMIPYGGALGPILAAGATYIAAD